MNRDIDLINRALADAGQEPLTDKAIQENVTTWRTCKEFYLPLLLEMLASAEWTSHKKRIRMEAYEDENLSKYRYAYNLPIDCSKPVMINDNEEYIVEGKILYTNAPDAILLYISNNRRTPSADLPETPDNNCYLVNGIYYRYDSEAAQWVEVDEDYHNYDDIELSPEESECFEKLLASQIALKITGDKQLYQLLFGIAQAIEDKCIKQSRSQGVSTEKGNDYWSDRLGLTVDGEYDI